MASDGADSIWQKTLMLLAGGQPGTVSEHDAPLSVRCVDLGASDRVSTLPIAMRRFVHLLAIDPDQSAWKQDEGYARLKWVDALVSDRQGPAIHYVTRKAQLGSLRKPNAGLVSRFPDPGRFEVVAEVPCETVLLADVVRAHGFAAPHFLKIDVQGCTQEVLEGAGSELDQVLMLQFEAEVLPLYLGQKLFSHNIHFLEQAGFQLLDIRPVYWMHQVESNDEQPHGRMAFSNVLMFRPPAWVAAQSDPEIVRTAAFLLVCFRHFDLAVEVLLLARERFPELAGLAEACGALVGIERLPFGRGSAPEWGDL